MPRKKPFSNKQKKLQLQQKRQKKREKDPQRRPSDPTLDGDPSHSDSRLESGSEDDDLHHQPGVPEPDVFHQPEVPEPVPIVHLNQQPVVPSATGKYDPNRYRLHFEQESRKEIERRKTEAKTLPVIPVMETELEVSVDEIYRPGSVLDIPKRPPWTYQMGKAQLEKKEEAMFEGFLKNIHSNHRPEELSYFEHNLETWRQLWRVLEISDVVLLITDVRHPALHFSPALYQYVVDDLKKKLILVLNKVDLVPPQVAVAWRHYFLSRFPQLQVISFTCYPNREASLQPSKKVSLKFRRKGCGRFLSAVGPRELFRVVESMYRGKIELAEWEHKLKESPLTGAGAGATGAGAPGVTGAVGGGMEPTREDSDISESEEEEEEEAVGMATTAVNSSPLVKDDISEGVLTIGMVGHPNVGKSSLLNELVEKKVVSTSRTPGHTKHFQTIFLTKSIRLCDCPGLVFPSLIDKQLQILSGMYPIAQVREPYTAVGYLAARVPVIQLLRLQHPDPDTRTRVETKTDSACGVSGKRVRDLAIADSNVPPESAWTLDSGAEKTEMKQSEGGGSLFGADGGTGAAQVWTPWDICDAWAERRGYYTSKAARFDTYRAANSILRLAVDGRISMYFRPPGFSKEKAEWESHPEVDEIIRLQREGLSSRTQVHGSSGVEGGGEEEEEEREGVAVSVKRRQSKRRVKGNKFSLLMDMDDLNL